MAAPSRRWIGLGLALLTGATLAVAPPGTGVAEPGNEHPVEEDAPPLLRDLLDTVGRDYQKAKAAAHESKKRQLQLDLEVQTAQARLDELTPQVGQLAAESYRSRELGAAAALLNSSGPDSFLARAVRLNEMNIVNDRKLRQLNAALADLNRAKKALDAEVRQEQKQLAIMARQKDKAEKALALVGGRGVTAGGLVAARSPIARPAPRGANGTFRSESCSQDDPSSSGCVTPRTLHAYKEVRRAGFDRLAGCYRSGGPFEHPKGRACDWSLRHNGFGAAANRDQRLYGNNLAAFLIRNADRLGVLYVIWYAAIWFPATGWRSYSGASDHRDHVHMSIM
jgi:hypothetical protein